MLYFRTNVVARVNAKLGLIRLRGKWPHKYWVFLIKIIDNQKGSFEKSVVHAQVASLLI